MCRSDYWCFDIVSRTFNLGAKMNDFIQGLLGLVAIIVGGIMYAVMAALPIALAVMIVLWLLK